MTARMMNVTQLKGNRQTNRPGRQRNRQTNRQTNRQRNRQANRQRNRQTNRQTNRPGRQRDRQTNRQTNRPGRQRDRQTERQEGRKAGRETTDKNIWVWVIIFVTQWTDSNLGLMARVFYRFKPLLSFCLSTFLGKDTYQPLLFCFHKKWPFIQLVNNKNRFFNSENNRFWCPLDLEKVRLEKKVN